MGLFDFVRDAGRKIFDSDAEAADNIKAHLEAKMTGLQNVDVQFEDGVATVCGDCASIADKDMVALIAGNIQGVESVDVDGLNAPDPEPQEVWEVTYHVVESGDTLGAIAKRYLGKSSAYMKIFNANKGLLSDPNKIYPGQKIRIPLDKNSE